MGPVGPTSTVWQHTASGSASAQQPLLLVPNVALQPTCVPKQGTDARGAVALAPLSMAASSMLHGTTLSITSPRGGAATTRRACGVDETAAVPPSQGESILKDLHLLVYKIPNYHHIKYQFAEPNSRNHGQNSGGSAQPVGRGRRHGADDARATARGCTQRLGGECARCKRLLREREVLPD